MPWVELKDSCIAAAVVESLESGSNVPLVPFGSDVVLDDDIVDGVDLKRVLDGSILSGYWRIISVDSVHNQSTIRFYDDNGDNTIDDVIVSFSDLKDTSKWRVGIDIGLTHKRSPRGSAWISGAVFRALVKGIYDWSNSRYSSFVTAYDVDFTSLGNILIDGDGEHIIDGKTWIKSNSASEVSPASIISGIGLRFLPSNDGNDYYGTIRTCPSIWVSLGDLIGGNYDHNINVRIFLYNSTNNSSLAKDSALLAVDPNHSSGDNSFGYSVYRGVYGGVEGVSGYIHTGSLSYGSGNFSAVIDETNNVIVLDIPNLNSGFATIMYGSYSVDDWPINSDIFLANSMRISTSNILTMYSGIMGVRLGAIRNLSLTDLSVTFARMEVQYR